MLMARNLFLRLQRFLRIYITPFYSYLYNIYISIIIYIYIYIYIIIDQTRLEVAFNHFAYKLP